MKQKTNKGITLIALVITIIVMLILVSVTINMAVNGGLFSYAGKAAKQYKEAEVKDELMEIITTATIEKAIAVEEFSLVDYLTSKVDYIEKIGETQYKIEYKKYDIIITENDVNYVISEIADACNHKYGEIITVEATCISQGRTEQTCTKCGRTKILTTIAKLPHNYVNKKCTMCEEKLVIGAKINYHEYIAPDGNKFAEMPSYTATKESTGHSSDQVFTVENNSNVEWIILGEEGNQIKITTKNVIRPTSGGAKYAGYIYLSFAGQAGYTNFVNELNKISAIYGKGKYADINKFQNKTTGGRSFIKEDLGYSNFTRTALCVYALEQHEGDTVPKVYKYAAGSTPDGTSDVGGEYTRFCYMELDASSETNEDVEGMKEWKELTEENPSVTIYDYSYEGNLTLNNSISRTGNQYWLASRGINRKDSNWKWGALVVAPARTWGFRRPSTCYTDKHAGHSS